MAAEAGALLLGALPPLEEGGSRTPDACDSRRLTEQLTTGDDATCDGRGECVVKCDTGGEEGVVRKYAQREISLDIFPWKTNGPL